MPAKKRYKSGSRELAYRKSHSADRSKANQARRVMKAHLTEKYGAAKAESMMKGKDVNHKKPISKGGTNSISNLELSSKKKNRSDKKMVRRKYTTKKK